MVPSEPRPDPQDRAPAVDGPTQRLPAVMPRARQCRAIPRPHRARAGELAALAFALPIAVPAQRDPSPQELRPAG